MNIWSEKHISDKKIFDNFVIKKKNVRANVQGVLSLCLFQKILYGELLLCDSNQVMKFQVRGYRIIKVLAFKWYDDMVYKTAEF